MGDIVGYGRRGFLPTNTFLVGKNPGAPFTTITAALVKAALVATSSARAIISISPGQYDENIIVPKYTSLIGISAGVQVTGDDISGGFIVEMGQGSSIENVTIAPVDADKDVGLMIRDATLQEGDEILASVNGTLIVNGKTGIGGDDETFTFTGESTTDACVALVNATAVNVFAYNRYGKLAIISQLDELTIYGAGTANTDLGFGVSDVLESRSSEPTVYISDVSIIGLGGYSALSGTKTYTVGLEAEDRGYGSLILNGVSITGADNTTTGRGLIIHRGTVMSANLMITGLLNGGIGIWMEDDNVTTTGQLVIGSGIVTANSTDLDGQTGSQILAIIMNSALVIGSSGFTFIPSGYVGALAQPSSWPYEGDGLDTAIEGLTDSSRKLFIQAKDMYSPSSGGAADIEAGTLIQSIKEFVTAADKKVTFSRKHITSSNTKVKASATLIVSCSISVNGGGSDAVRISTSLLSVAIGANLEAAGAETLVDDVDVSAISADDRFDVTFNFTNAGALADPGDLTEALILREGTHENDTYGGSLHVWGAEWEV